MNKSNYAQNKKNIKIKLSDHRPLILKLNLEFSMLKPQRVEGFNFKREECGANFSDITENASQLVKCFEFNLPIKEQAIMWEKRRKKYFKNI